MCWIFGEAGRRGDRNTDGAFLLIVATCDGMKSSVCIIKYLNLNCNHPKR